MSSGSPGNSEPKAYLASIGTATPRYTASQAEADAFFTKHYSGKLSGRMLSLMHKIFAHPSISKRTFALEDPDCLVDEAPDSRIGRFTSWSIGLSEEAGRKAMDEAGLVPADISCIIVNTCTGYLCPGISTYLIERLGLSPGVRAYDLVGSGCGGALPNIDIAAAQVRAGYGPALCISVEVCSATFQMGDDLSLVLSNALFGDGAAAAVIWDRPEGLELTSFASRYVPALRDHIRYVHKNGALHNQLSTRLPGIISKEAAAVVGRILGPESLDVSHVAYWAIHPGGDKIIHEIKDELGLTETQLRQTRKVLSEHGNMSSPTVLFVLRELLDAGMEKNDWCAMVAFGAGLSAHACLLRKV